MKTNRYVTQSAVVLGLFALLTVPQVVGQADEATAPVSTTSTETVADSGASVVSGQGTSGTAVQGGTETVSATPTTVATNASTEPSANTSTNQASQEASAVLTNANQVTPAVPVQAETVTEPAHEGQTVDMQILSTTDLHTNLVNYDYYQDKPSQTVGLSKTAVLIKKARETNPNTVLVDSGDTIQGTPFGTYKALIDPVSQGETHPMYKAFEMLGYDAETLGNHEFNYGLEFLDRMVKAAKINIINANVRNAQTGDYYYNPYKIVNKTFTDTDGKQVTLKIGITGVLPTQILVWDKANLEGKVTVDDPMEAVKAIVPKMKAAGADYILVAAHSGIGDNEYTKNEENEGYQIAGIEGVDAVATGHSHADFPNGDGTSFYAKYPGVDDVNGLINGKPVVMAGKFGDHLGIMDVKLTYTDGKWKVVNSKAKLEKIDTKSDVADKDLIDMAAHDHNGTINYVRKEVGETTAPITSYFAQVQDDPSIQIVNNAQLWYAKKQVAGTADENLPLLSAAAPFKAGTRGDATYYTDIPAGPLAIKNVADLYLYDNVTALLKVTGAQIKEWLEMSAGQFNQIDPNSKEPQQLINSSYRSYNYDVIDGLTYKFDLTQPNKYDREGKLVNPDASRVRDLAYQGKPIDLNQTFLVVTNNYRATGNFPGVKDAAEKRLLNLENRQAIIDYIVSEKTINPTADGNWSFVPNITNADIRFASSDNARAHLAGQDAISYVGPSTQAGFAEYRLIVKEKTNQVEDTTNKESEKSPKGSETADQTKRETPKATVGASVAKPAPAIQLSNAQVVILPQAQVQEAQGSSSVKALPNTGSDESVSATLAGLVLMTLAGFFGIKKHEKN